MIRHFLYLFKARVVFMKASTKRTLICFFLAETKLLNETNLYKIFVNLMQKGHDQNTTTIQSPILLLKANLQENKWYFQTKILSLFIASVKYFAYIQPSSMWKVLHVPPISTALKIRYTLNGNSLLHLSVG